MSIKPPAGTVAIVVDVGINKGAVRIYKETSSKFLKKVSAPRVDFSVKQPSHLHKVGDVDRVRNASYVYVCIEIYS
jgi:hypothetical protein